MGTDRVWVPTHTGKRVNPLHPDPAQICLVDIAHALSQICRYAGHTIHPYSVAEHSIILAGVVGPSLTHQRVAMLHDGAEAYILDMIAPIKRMPSMQFYRDIDDTLTGVIFEKYGLPINAFDNYMRKFDRAMCWAEVRAGLMAHPEALPYLSEYENPELRAIGDQIYEQMCREKYGTWGGAPAQQIERMFLSVCDCLKISD